MKLGTFSDQQPTIRRGSVVHIFRDCETQDPYFTLQAILARGQVPLLTLEPWHGLGRAAQWVAGFDLLPGRVYVRYGHEMNGDWYPWSANSQVYRRDWQMLASSCPPNVSTIWCPNVDSPTSPITRARDFWPGTADMVGLDGYSWNGDSADVVFGPSLRAMTAWPFARLPWWICETAFPRDRSGLQAAWVHGLKRWAAKNQATGLVYFDQDKEKPWAMNDAARQVFWHGGTDSTAPSGAM